MQRFNLNLSLFIFVMLVFVPNLQAQQITPQTLQPPVLNDCAADELHEKLLEDNPEYRQRHEKVEQEMYEMAINQPFADQKMVLTIPVVVHVMHLPGEAIGTGSNISDAQILAGMEHLNDAFRNIGAYAGDPSNTNAGIPAADIEIEFCLATQDPGGNADDGINRVATSYSNLYFQDPGPNAGQDQDAYIKSLSFYDSNDYMNIWLVNEICTNQVPESGCGTAGYAYLAGAHGFAIDGIVNEADLFGSSTDNSKVHIHEVGHYLNLRHTFNDGCTETNCLTGGDFICDTPPDAGTSAVNCFVNGTINTCSNDASIVNSPFASDVQDIYENYMDYGFQQCQNSFTPDQKTRMRNALQGARVSLLSSNGCNAAAPPIADFTATTLFACVNTPIQFADASQNGATSWAWEFPGGSPATSTTDNPVVSYAAAGSYDVRLTASNSLGTSVQEVKTDYITIYNEPTVAFAPNATPAGSAGITYFTVADIENPSSTATGDGSRYMDNACSMVTEMEASTTYDFTFTAGDCPSDLFEVIRIYIDYNNDGDFADANENAYSSGGNAYCGTWSFSFTTPPSVPVTNQILRMRVITDNQFISSPNHTPNQGQVEDYGVLFRSVLPVELSDFSAEQEKEGVQLNWLTEFERNNDFFTLERSEDGERFYEIAYVEGAGNSEDKLRYGHFDNAPLSGDNFYRLRQTDFDGTESVSDIVRVEYLREDTHVEIYPNPVKTNSLNLVYVTENTGEMTVEIINPDGKTLQITDYGLTAGLNRTAVDLPALTAGMYFLRITEGDRITVKRFMKN